MRTDVKIGLLIGLVVFGVIAVFFMLSSGGDPEQSVAQPENPPVAPAPPPPPRERSVPLPYGPRTPDVATPVAGGPGIGGPAADPAGAGSPAVPLIPPGGSSGATDPLGPLARGGTDTPGADGTAVGTNQGGIRVMDPWGAIPRPPVGGAATAPVDNTPRTSPPNAAPPAPATQRKYVVKAGDNGFTDIARKEYGDARHWQLIASANPGVDSRTLRVGQELVLPPLPPATPGASGSAVAGEPGTARRLVTGGQEYVVKAGDSLWKIAETHYGKGSLHTEILKANPDLQSSTLRVGQRITLPEIPSTPGGSTAAPAVSRTPVEPAAAASGAPAGDGRRPDRPWFGPR